MDDASDSKPDGHRHLSKARMMGKLFGREKKPSNTTNSEVEVSAFLHGPPDKLYMATASQLPKLLKIDTSQASRWPTAAQINHSRATSRGHSASPKRSKKGLIVRFADKQPEIIGEGGDEAESPTLEISIRKRSNSHPSVLQHSIQMNAPASDALYWSTDGGLSDFRPSPLRRTQTGREAIREEWFSKFEPQMKQEHNGSAPPPSTRATSAEPPHPKSFATRARTEMREDGGKVLKLDSKTAEVVNGTSRGVQIPQSSTSSPIPPSTSLAQPSSLNIPPQLTPGLRPQEVSLAGTIPNPIRSQAAPVAIGTEMLNSFSARVQHLFKLFELSAESVMPLSTSTFEALVRAASWWFLRGRNSIEALIRARSSSLDGHQGYDISQQQAHADIGKSVWIITHIITQRAELKNHTTDDLHDISTSLRSSGDDHLASLLERCQALTISLRNLAISMQRHDCLPPPVGEAPLPQGLDPSIWIKYPVITQEKVFVLSGRDHEAIGPPALSSRLSLSDSMPLGDTKMSFNYASMFVDILLVEQGVEWQQLRHPCILSLSREKTERALTVTVSSQNGLILLSVKSESSVGPTWSNVIWQTRLSAVDLKLSRGMLARIQFLPHDFKNFWSMYEYTSKVRATFWPRKEEKIIYERTLKSFRVFDRDPQSRAFPKEAITQCQIRVFEKRSAENAGSSAGTIHRGFRITIITGTKSKNLSCISQDVLPTKPLQYGFMRGEIGAPALLLKFEDGTRNLTMVMTFDDMSARSLLHNCITGGPGKDETVLAHVQIKQMSITSLSQIGSIDARNALDALGWQGIRVIQKAEINVPDTEPTAAVMSDNLRIVVDSKIGILADRINAGSGEFKIRLNPQLPANEILVIRQQQNDMSVSISESQVVKDKPQDLAKLLEMVAKSQTIRKYSFLEMEGLHMFQEALTGFNILFDGLVETFAICRRRMVVHIYKKWEASMARLQVLRQNKTVQLAVFFEDFSHGECMNFILKATDSFETFTRSGKFCVRIVDAKFALPKGGGDEKYEGDDKGYISLKMPDNPTEEDDIMITFSSEADRDKFAKVLPAPAKAGSKLSTVMR